MDILHLIDRLEEEISQGRRLPFADTVILNEQRLWDIIDTMRISIPEEVQAAQQVDREHERILAQAREEAGRIIDLARKRAQEMTSGHELMQNAQAEAMEIVSRGQVEVRRLQAEADSYALGVMGELEERLEQVLQTVRNGVELLSSREERKESSDSEGVSGPGGGVSMSRVSEKRGR